MKLDILMKMFRSETWPELFSFTIVLRGISIFAYKFAVNATMVIEGVVYGRSVGD